jgi:ATP-binding cassette subfamily F protein 3
MLSIQNLSFYFGSRPLYENINLHIKPKDRIGFIGANGAGKSTLLRLIVGEYTPDSGSIGKAKDCTIGFLNQDLLSYQTENSILSVALEAFEEANIIQRQIDDIIHQLETEYSDALVEKLTNLQARLEAIGGYAIEAEAEKILEGLGFSTADLQKPLRQFSGGWRMRVMLAKMLLQKPALLLLDEPTNHLDLPSIQWLEEYLNNYEGAIVIVTHDREFLQNTANIIVEITGRQLHYYAGDYDYYIEEKLMRREIHKASYENQQAQIRQTERFIERFRSKATKARQVQSRVKALERMDKIEDVVDENAKVHFRFNFGQASGKVVAELKDLGKAYGDLVIMQNSNATIERGDKIALIGANGRGKSTLLRILDGSEPVEGKVEIGYNVRDAFYAQHQLESLDLDNEIINELKQAGSNKTETELRTILGCFLFNGDEVFKKIKVLSGGEKSRVALAKVLLSEANFLLLDEPTNHLDMQSVNILIQALTQYEGTFVVVSHDRHFVANIANKIWYIENHELKEYLGTYDEYEYWRLQRLEEEKASGTKNEPKKDKEKALPTQTMPSPDAEKEKQRKKLQKQLETIESDITNLEKEVKQAEINLASPDLYNQKDKLASAQTAFELAKQKLAQKQTEWDNLAVELDSF